MLCCVIGGIKMDSDNFEKNEMHVGSNTDELTSENLTSTTLKPVNTHQ